MEKEWRVIIMLDFFSMLLARAGISGGGGGGGFTPTDEQLAAMDSGITAARLTEDEANIAASKSKTDRIIMDDTEDTLLFVQATQPTGNIPDGSIWINTAVSNP